MGRTEPNRWTPKKLGNPPTSRRARSVSATDLAAVASSTASFLMTMWNRLPARPPISRGRSEERRVGKECRAGRAPDHWKRRENEGGTVRSETKEQKDTGRDDSYRLITAMHLGTQRS